MNKDIETKVFSIFSDIMNVPVEDLVLTSNSDNIASWDSLSHVKLIMQVEHQFKISLLPEEAMEIFSVKDIINIISSKIL